MQLKKVAIIGPESSGKSVFTQQLASYFRTLFVPEYAREYLETKGINYTVEDLNHIAKGQLRIEDETIKELEKQSIPDLRKNIVFIDTEMYVMKVWSEYVFNRCETWILNEIVKRKYDLFLLCRPDIPWIKDNLREYPDFSTRERLFSYYLDAMVNQPIPWVVIEGEFDQREKTALIAIDTLFQ